MNALAATHNFDTLPPSNNPIIFPGPEDANLARASHDLHALSSGQYRLARGCILFVLLVGPVGLEPTTKEL